MTTRLQVLQILSDGAYHSGTELGATLGISRAAVNKIINRLVGKGVEIHAASGRGYRLAEAFRPLDQAAVAGVITDSGNRGPVRLHLFDEIESTSQYLLDLADEQEISGHVCLAEHQTGGRGRRGRQWLTSPYSNLMLSLAWRFQGGPASLSGLSLAAGVAVAGALRAAGVEGVGLKWPNDLLWHERKLGGVLADVQGEAAGPSLVVIGIGLNVYQHQQVAAGIDQPWVDLYTATGRLEDRSKLAGLLIASLYNMLVAFEAGGFHVFRESWRALHAHAGLPVRLMFGTDEIQGEALDVDETGALVLRDGSGQVRKFHSGEVSLRRA